MKCCTHAAAVITISVVIGLFESVSQMNQKAFFSYWSYDKLMANGWRSSNHLIKSTVCISF